MRCKGLAVVLSLAVLVPVFMTNGVAAQAPHGLATGSDPILMLSRAPAFRATANTAAQDPAAAEASLVLDRPTRRLIQQGLRNEGFDPGAPDGLFGPRTRAAIRNWQQAQGEAASGYLNRVQAELLRAATAPLPGAAATAPPAVVESPVAPTPTANCEGWNTESFFETATSAIVRACLAAGTDVAARDDDSITPLHWAAWSSKEAAVIEALLAAGADIEARNDDGSTPLHSAAINNETLVVIEVLLAAGADIEARETRDENGTPLQHAAYWNRNVAVLESLLAAGADSTVRTDNGRTLLHLASFGNGNPEVIEALLAAGADIEARTDSGVTPLFEAAGGNQNPAVLETLLAAGADVTARLNNGLSPLHQAARSNTPTIVEVLLVAGADIAAQTDGGTTPLSLAARENENPAVLETLLAAGANLAWRAANGRTLLHLAARSNENPAMVETLLAAGAELEAYDELGGYTPLYLAVNENPNPAVLEALVAAGADVNTRRDGIWHTPLEMLVQRTVRTDEVLSKVEILLAAGVDINDLCCNGYSALSFAAWEGVPAVVEALLAAGYAVRSRVWQVAFYNDNPAVVDMLVAAIDPRTRLSFGETALHWVAEEGSLANVARLLAAGADVTARSAPGQTALHWAAGFPGNDDPAVVEALLAAGADLAARDTEGQTALHLAAEFSDNPAVVEALLAVGADATARDGEGQTPWDLVQENEALKGSDVYWRLNDARFSAPRQESRRPPTTRPSQRRDAASEPSQRQGPGCEIPGYPTPANLQEVGLNWCSANVDFQRRVFALQAAGAWCAIAAGTSSTQEQIDTRHQEINAACDALDALGGRGGPPCQCPTGYRP